MPATDDDDDLAGHLGHLSPAQESAFAAFKNILNTARLYTPSSDPHVPASTDDPTLL